MLLGRSWSLLGRSWATLGSSWARLGRFWITLQTSFVEKIQFSRNHNKTNEKHKRITPLAALGALLATLARSEGALGRSWAALKAL